MLSLAERSYWESFSRLVQESLPYRVPIYTVAIDGSGSLQMAENIGVCYAAVYSFDRVWIPFCKQWWSVLEAYHFDYFRTAEAMNFSGHFGEAARRWEGDRNARRDELMLELVGLQKKHKIDGVMQIDDNRFLWEKARAGGDDEKKVSARKMVVFRDFDPEAFCATFQSLSTCNYCVMTSKTWPSKSTSSTARPRFKTPRLRRV